jgi:hypothetical protein
MKKDYTYTRAIEFDFDYLIKEYELDKEDFETCQYAVHDYVSGLDDEYYYLIDNEDEIARDLFDYIQSKK